MVSILCVHSASVICSICYSESSEYKNDLRVIAFVTAIVKAVAKTFAIFPFLILLYFN